MLLKKPRNKLHFEGSRMDFSRLAALFRRLRVCLATSRAYIKRHIFDDKFKFEGKHNLLTDIHGKKRFIFYLNIDHFYTAVEERENLALKGKPVVVGANPKEAKATA